MCTCLWLGLTVLRWPGWQDIKIRLLTNFMCYCGDTGVERILKWEWSRKITFSRRSCRDSRVRRGFIWAGVATCSAVIKQTSDIIRVDSNKPTTVWAPTKNCSLADSFLDPMALYGSSWKKDIVNRGLEFMFNSSGTYHTPNLAFRHPSSKFWAVSGYAIEGALLISAHLSVEISL